MGVLATIKPLEAAVAGLQMGNPARFAARIRNGILDRTPVEDTPRFKYDQAPVQLGSAMLTR